MYAKFTVSTAWKRPGPKDVVSCLDGPLEGHALALDRETGRTTGVFELNGERGRYVGGRWEAMS